MIQVHRTDRPAVFARRAYVSILLITIAFLGAFALSNGQNLRPVHAQTDYPQLYVEPGVTRLRAPDGSMEVQGKVVIDLRTGEIWGFPTNSTVAYPIDMNTSQPPTSKPLYLGKYDFSAMKRSAGKTHAF